MCGGGLTVEVPGTARVADPTSADACPPPSRQLGLAAAGQPVLRVPHLARLVKRQLAGGRAGDKADSGDCGCLSCSRMRRLAAAKSASDSTP